MPKSKKNIKVQDLKPSKDAKGGGDHGTQRHHGRRAQGGASSATQGGSASATQGGGVANG